MLFYIVRPNPFLVPFEKLPSCIAPFLRSTTIPNSKKIVEYLSNHVGLRGINENQTVIFNDLRANQSSILKPTKPKGELVVDKEVIVKGYNKKAWLKIWKFRMLVQICWIGLVIPMSVGR